LSYSEKAMDIGRASSRKCSPLTHLLETDQMVNSYDNLFRLSSKIKTQMFAQGLTRYQESAWRVSSGPPAGPRQPHTMQTNSSLLNQD
jgi:hypothetical protein